MFELPPERGSESENVGYLCVLEEAREITMKEGMLLSLPPANALPLRPPHLHVLVEHGLDVLVDARLQHGSQEVHGDGRIYETRCHL